MNPRPKKPRTGDIRMRITIMRLVQGEYGRRWFHRFKHHESMFDRAPIFKRSLVINK